MAHRTGRNAAPDTSFSGALNAALAEADGEATKLHRIASTLVALAIDGNLAAIKEIGDRLDGRPGTNPGAPAGEGEEGPVRVTVEWVDE